MKRKVQRDRYYARIYRKWKKNLPSLKLETSDYFSRPLPEMFDIVLCSGALNSNFGTREENLEFRKKQSK